MLTVNSGMAKPQALLFCNIRAGRNFCTRGPVDCTAFDPILAPRILSIQPEEGRSDNFLLVHFRSIT
jgi:hypothetical protein